MPIYDIGYYDDLLYVAMRYIAGADMRQMIRNAGGCSGYRGVPGRAGGAGARRRIGKGLVHRDVKPGDLLINAAATTAKSRSPLPGRFRDHQACDVAKRPDRDRAVRRDHRLRGTEADPGADR